MSHASRAPGDSPGGRATLHACATSGLPVKSLRVVAVPGGGRTQTLVSRGPFGDRDAGPVGVTIAASQQNHLIPFLGVPPLDPAGAWTHRTGVPGVARVSGNRGWHPQPTEPRATGTRSHRRCCHSWTHGFFPLGTQCHIEGSGLMRLSWVHSGTSAIKQCPASKSVRRDSMQWETLREGQAEALRAGKANPHPEYKCIPVRTTPGTAAWKGLHRANLPRGL